MLDLLEERGGDTLRLIERELRCGFWTWNLRTNEMRWSRGYYNLLGLEHGSVSPSFAAILQVTHPEDRKPQAEAERIIRRASTVRRKFRVIRPGGSVAWLFCQIVILVDPDGISQVAVGVCSDVTRGEEQLDSLRLADERYRALVQATDALVWIARSDGSMHEVVNWRSKRSDSEAAVLASGWIDLIHPEDRERTVRVWSDALRNKVRFDVVHRIRQPDGGYRWKRSRGQPVLDDQGGLKEWLGINTDLEWQLQGSPQRSRRLTGAQIRAARGLLRWSVADLAKASGISRATIRRLEEGDGPPSHNDPALAPIEQTFSHAGVEFLFPEIGKPGVRPR